MDSCMPTVPFRYHPRAFIPVLSCGPQPSGPFGLRASAAAAPDRTPLHRRARRRSSGPCGSRCAALAVGVARVDEAALEQGLTDCAEGVVHHPVAEGGGGDDAMLGVEDFDGLVTARRAAACPGQAGRPPVPRRKNRPVGKTGDAASCDGGHNRGQPATSVGGGPRWPRRWQRGTEPCASSTPPVPSNPASTTASPRSNASTWRKCWRSCGARSTSCCTRRARRARPPLCWRSATCSTHRATAACTPPSRPRARPATTWSGRCARCSPDWARTRGRRWATTSWPSTGPAFSPSSARTMRCAKR